MEKNEKLFRKKGYSGIVNDEEPENINRKVR